MPGHLPHPRLPSSLTHTCLRWPYCPPQIHEYKAQVLSLQSSLADAEKRVFEGEQIRRILHNTIQVRQARPGAGQGYARR